MERYQHLIRFSVHGHLHMEQQQVTRSTSSNKPLSVQYWASALSAYSHGNPAFRMYEVDALTMLPVKVHTYILNLKE